MAWTDAMTLGFIGPVADHGKRMNTEYVKAGNSLDLTGKFVAYTK